MEAVTVVDLFTMYMYVLLKYGVMLLPFNIHVCVCIPVVVCPVTQSPLLYIIIVVILHHRCSCLNVCNACYPYTRTCTCTCSRYNSVCKVTCSGGVVCIEILDEVWLSSSPQLHKGSNLICECILVWFL